MTEFEQLIRNHIHLESPNARGWEACVHQSCDHGKKGPRAAFRFDGDVVGFSCFNCGKSAKFDPGESPYISKNFKEILDSFGIDDTALKSITFAYLKAAKDGTIKSAAPVNVRSLYPPEITTPDTFYFLKDAAKDDIWAEIAREYLIVDRNIDPDAYPFMLSEKTLEPSLVGFYKRVIVPIYDRQQRLIYYSGRDLTGKSQRRYLNCKEDNARVIYGMDQLHDYSNGNKPLYITEGWFDAFSIGGIAVFGNQLSDEQIKIIDSSSREKVYIPDLQGNGALAALAALKAGWNISIPEIPGCKDMNDAVKKYGKLYTLKTLADNTTNGVEAELKLKLFVD